MQTCPECGNHGMRVHVVDGLPAHECGLCGARFGERRAVEALNLSDEARARGIAVGIWPLVRALEALSGLHVRSCMPPDVEARTLPFVELGLGSPHGLVQLENLAKSLRLAAGGLRLHWIVELEYRHQLVFVLKPRHAGGAVPAAAARDAAVDIDTLRRQLERDPLLSWWRHAGAGPSG